MKNKIITFWIILLLPVMAFCYSKHKPAGIGRIAENMMEPVSVFSDFVTSASLILGISFLFGAFFRYLQYRVNRLATPLGTVVILFILGVILILIPLASKLGL